MMSVPLVLITVSKIVVTQSHTGVVVATLAIVYVLMEEHVKVITWILSTVALTNLVPEKNLDINECSTNNGGCAHTCTNTIGSYACSCNTGFTLDFDNHGCIGI